MKKLLILLLLFSACKRVYPPIYTDKNGKQFYLKEKCINGHWKFSGKAQNWECDKVQTQIIYIK